MDPSEAILVFTTGGAIDKHYFDALSEYRVGETAVTKLLAIARVKPPHPVEELFRKDSLDFTAEDRTRIVARVGRAVFSRIVITHGTDTMTDTAQALAGAAKRSRKTIVLTGALAPAKFSESDAAFNFGMAFATAQTAPPGVYITINGSVFRAHEVTKDRERG